MFFFTPVVATLSAAATHVRAYTLRSVSTSPTGQSAGNFTLQQSARGYTLSGGQPYESHWQRFGHQNASEQPIAVHVEGLKLKMTCPSQMQAVLVPSGSNNPPSWIVEFVLETEGLPEGTVVDGWTTTDDKMGLPATGRYTKIVNSIGNYGGYYAPLLLGDGESQALTWFNQDVSAHGNAQWWMVIDEGSDSLC
ncbi:uncharacterized protein SCHCODRAFT_02619597 [Schizophyllum commune H4-8]|uniref:uncharacterized protein n=1 Tax=Schizophyllum commune (strain H4-8 / FGSC 9210) TaxID=578458 RepID=UPI00215F5807|nr:uncharacterized protein SCHCODRAFT_02619597 [Schizophyllum commune H4-8]KAI5895499.1 hypothetical protein SCHCODRAFT_02619597 [Schizophyllum commune H4-8]